jgi:hypothetical protein
MGDDDIALWGGELDCSETGYSPKCLERLSNNSGTDPIWTPTSGQNGPRSTISLP